MLNFIISVIRLNVNVPNPPLRGRNNVTEKKDTALGSLQEKHFKYKTG